jgi:hypothetical protein
VNLTYHSYIPDFVFLILVLLRVVYLTINCSILSIIEEPYIITILDRVSFAPSATFIINNELNEVIWYKLIIKVQENIDRENLFRCSQWKQREGTTPIFKYWVLYYYVIPIKNLSKNNEWYEEKKITSNWLCDNKRSTISNITVRWG